MKITKDTFFKKIIDYSVSKESFELYHNTEFDILITHPQPQVLEKYYESDDYISHTDGSRSLFEQCYQFIKHKAIRNKSKLLLKINPQKGNLLDIGAGTGDFLFAMKAAGWNVTGTEPSAKARKISEKKNIDLLETTSHLLSHNYDIITMWHVLEHVSDLNNQINELRRLLAPGGTLIVAVPNYKSYDAQFYGEYWAAYDVPRHLWHFSKTSISKLFGLYGIELIEVLPMKFDSFYVSLLSEKYRHGKMQLLKAFFIGLKSNIKAKKEINYSSHIYILKNLK